MLTSCQRSNWMSLQRFPAARWSQRNTLPAYPRLSRECFFDVDLPSSSCGGGLPFSFRERSLDRISTWKSPFYLRQGGYVFTCVCSSVCLSVNRIIRKLLIIFFYKILQNGCQVGHNPRINRLDFGWPLPKVRVIRGQKVTTFCE